MMFGLFTYCFVFVRVRTLQGAVAAGSPEGHGGSDEAAAGKPQKR